MQPTDLITEGVAPESQRDSQQRLAMPREQEPTVARTKDAVRSGVGGVRFTRDDAEQAGNEWRFNCGPGALCAVLGMTPAELRPHMLDFEAKGYTNPSLMYGVLDKLGVQYRQCYRGDGPASGHTLYPRFGLVRIQWGGPWTKPGVPMRARYRQTHWIATRGEPSAREAFDINAICVGGWLPWTEWATQLAPWLIREAVPKGSGEWWPTHSIEVLSLGGGGAELGANVVTCGTKNGAQGHSAKGEP